MKNNLFTGATLPAFRQIIVCLFFLKVFPGDGLASEFPVLICLAFLLIKYLVLLVKTLYTRYRLIASPKVSSLIKRHKTRNLPHHHFYCCAILWMKRFLSIKRCKQGCSPDCPLSKQFWQSAGNYLPISLVTICLPPDTNNIEGGLTGIRHHFER